MVDGFIAQQGLDAPAESMPVLRNGYEVDEIGELDLLSVGVTTIIWAMGYNFDFNPVKLPVFDEDGYPDSETRYNGIPGVVFRGFTLAQQDEVRTAGGGGGGCGIPGVRDCGVGVVMPASSPLPPFPVGRGISIEKGGCDLAKPNRILLSILSCGYSDRVQYAYGNHPGLHQRPGGLRLFPHPGDRTRAAMAPCWPLPRAARQLRRSWRCHPRGDEAQRRQRAHLECAGRWWARTARRWLPARRRWWMSKRGWCCWFSTRRLSTSSRWPRARACARSSSRAARIMGRPGVSR